MKQLEGSWREGRRTRYVWLGLFAAAVLLRAALWPRDLPYYSIDENDVVEPAIACASGDWMPGRFDYGPFGGYLLALPYLVLRAGYGVFSQGGDAAFFHQAFFSPGVFYILARAFHSLLILASALAGWVLCRRHFDGTTPAVALILGLAPLSDLTTQRSFTCRVDTLQGLLALLCLSSLARAMGGGRTAARHHLLAGCAIGLSLATKPFTGLLLLPAVFFGYMAGFWGRDPAVTAGSKLAAALRRGLASRGIWLMAGAAAVAHFAANPYALMDFPGFIKSLYEAMAFHSGAQWDYYGYDFRWMAVVWGVPMAAMVLVALSSAFVWRSAVSVMCWIYCATFTLVFFPFFIRPYWYNAILPVLVPLVALSVTRLAALPILSKRFDPSRAAIVLAMALLVFPWAKSSSEAWSAWIPKPSIDRRADRAAQAWIEERVPSGSRILAVGWYPINLPRLVADTPDGQAAWGEYFMYGRGNSLPLQRKFSAAFASYRRSGGPAYRIENLRVNYEGSPAVRGLAPLFNDGLAEYGRSKGVAYIVTASPTGFAGRWEEREAGRRVAVFNRAGGFFGDEVKIWRLGED